MEAQHEIHQDMQVLIDARGSKNPDATVTEQRRLWNEYAAKLSRPCPESLVVENLSVAVGDRAVPVRLYKHRNASTPSPCVIYMHGGGFMLGDLDSSDSIAWGYAVETGATVVSIDYRLTPEHVWPAAFDDCFGVISWIAEHGETLGIDTSRLALAGDSAGGRLTAGVCLKARDENGPKIAAQAIVYGSGGAVPESRSMVDYAEGYGYTAARSKQFYATLFPDQKYLEDPYAFPIRAEDLTNLPPALIHSAELDPIRDDGRAYAARLTLAGNHVIYREARGMLHGFMRARFTGQTARAEFESICSFLRSNLA